MSDLEKLYDEGRRLFLKRKYEEALNQFKRIYEVDYDFRDTAEIVEDSYGMPVGEWREKYRIRFSKSKDEP